MDKYHMDKYHMDKYHINNYHLDKVHVVKYHKFNNHMVQYHTYMVPIRMDYWIRVLQSNRYQGKIQTLPRKLRNTRLMPNRRGLELRLVAPEFLLLNIYIIWIKVLIGSNLNHRVNNFKRWNPRSQGRRSINHFQQPKLLKV